MLILFLFNYAARVVDLQKPVDYINDPFVFYNLRPLQRRFNPTFKTHEDVYIAEFKEPEEAIADAYNILTSSLYYLITAVTKDFKPDDFAQINISSEDALEYPISYPFMLIKNITLDVIYEELARILNSNQVFKIDKNLILRVVTVQLPTGGAHKRDSNLVIQLQKSRSVIIIRNKDDLCMARAISVSLAKLLFLLFNKNENKPSWVPEWMFSIFWGKRKYANITRSENPQKIAALTLHDKTGIPIQKCGLVELAIFDKFLNNYNIGVNVYDSVLGGQCIYKSSSVEYKIFIHFHKEHFNSITSMSGFLRCSYFCEKCLVSYSNKTRHLCEDRCGSCYTSLSGDNKCSGAKIRCTRCFRIFNGDNCYKKHIILKVCQNYKMCPSCNMYLNGQKAVATHDCNIVKCPICKQNHKLSDNHKCYIIPITGDLYEAKKRKTQTPYPLEPESSIDPTMVNRFRLIAFDFETSTKYIENEIEMRHTVLCAVGISSCEMCQEETNLEFYCENCCREKIVRFIGENSLNDFCNWLFRRSTPHEITTIAYAHNLGSFDGLFILKFIYEQGLIPNIICRGNKILSLSVKGFNIKMIDSLNFLKCRLKDMPKTLGIMGESGTIKGDFPYLILKEELLGRVFDTHPPISYYDLKGKNEAEKNIFMTWYLQNRRKPFDFNKQLLEYCEQDVVILNKCMLLFQKLFMTMTVHKKAVFGIPPLTSGITLAGACSVVWRRLFLEKNSVAIFANQGVMPCRNQSLIALRWLKYLNIINKYDPPILHAKNGGEKEVNGLFLDGYRYDVKNKKHVAYEFCGCWYHAHPPCVNEDSVHPFKKIKMREVYNETIFRLERLRNWGLEVIVIWECEFSNFLKNNSEANSIVESLDIATAINPRDSLFGGRTNALHLYSEADEHTVISYVDYCSLYPFTQKTFPFPKGHPVIYSENFGDMGTAHERFKGLFKCRVLPPRKLYLPVLPVHIHKKLSFVLCRTCAELSSPTSCMHKDNKRAFVGIWTHAEIKKSVEMGYKILKIFEIWHWDIWSHDLFKEYIDTFYRLKLQSSGFPSGVETEKEKRQYIKLIEKEENISLEYDKVFFNPGLRSLAKLILNSQWGKMCQRSQLSKVVYFKNPGDFLKFIINKENNIKDIQLITETLVRVTFEKQDFFVENNLNVNCVLASYVTSYGRLMLYDLISLLGDDCLYYDTDSCIYRRPRSDSEDKVKCGARMGDLTCELAAGTHIKYFVSIGPKSYSYIDNNGHCKTVLKGFTMRYFDKDLTFQTLKDMIFKVKNKEKVTVCEPRKFVSNPIIGGVTVTPRNKTLQLVYTKRRLIPNEKGEMIKTLPFGFCED